MRKMEKSSDNEQTAVIEEVGFTDRCRYMMKYPIYRWGTFHHIPPHIMRELIKNGEYYLQKGEKYVLYDFRYRYYKRKGVKVPPNKTIGEGTYLKLTEDKNDIEVYAADGLGCIKELSREIKFKGNIKKYREEQERQKQAENACKDKKTLRERLPYMGAIPYFCKENNGLVACNILIAFAVISVRQIIEQAHILMNLF